MELGDLKLSDTIVAVFGGFHCKCYNAREELRGRLQVRSVDEKIGKGWPFNTWWIRCQSKGGMITCPA